MKKQFLTLMMLGLMMTASALVRAEGNFAFVDMQAAINQVDEGRRAMESLKADYDSKMKSLQGMQNEIQKMRQDLDKQKSVLSDEALNAKAKELMAKYDEFKKKAADYEADFSKKQGDALQKIVTKMKPVVQSVGKSSGYDMIFEAGAVIYSGNAKDITADVIKAYNSGKK